MDEFDIEGYLQRLHDKKEALQQEVEMPRVGTISRQTMDERFVHIAEGNRVAILPPPGKAGHVLIMKFFDAKQMFKASTQTIIVNDRERDVELIDVWVRDDDKMIAHDITSAIGEGRIIMDENRKLLNLWTPHKRRKVAPEPTRAILRGFLEHLNYLVPEEAERRHFLRCLAWLEQHPDKPMQFATLMFTPTFGTGRNLLASMLGKVWPGEVAGNIDLAEMLNSSYNGIISNKRLVVVDEIHLTEGRQSLYQLEAKIRQMVTADEIVINKKYGGQWTEKARCHYLLFSNHIDALPIRPGDRRFNVIANPVERKDADYYIRMYALMEQKGFGDAVGQFLADFDLSDFNPGEHPTLNAAKEDIIDATTPDLERDINEVLAEWPTYVTTIADLAAVAGVDAKDKSISKQMGHILRKRCKLFGKRFSVERYNGGKALVRAWIITGHKDWVGGQTTVGDLQKKIGEYRRSDWFKTAVVEAENEEAGGGAF